MNGLGWTQGRRLHEIPQHAAAVAPDAPALIVGERTFSFADVVDRVQRTAGVISGCTPPGARVAVVGDNHWSWIDTYYGVPAAGRILVFANHRLAPPELRSVLDRSGATVLVGPRADIERIDPGPAVRTTFDLDEWEAAVAAADPALARRGRDRGRRRRS